MAVLGAAVFIAGGAVPASAASELIFYNHSSERCLDSNYNGNVYTLRCNGGNYQNWYIASGGQNIVDAQTGRCLDSNYNGNVYTLPCNGGNYQNWNFYENYTGGILIQDVQTYRCLSDFFGIYTSSCQSVWVQGWYVWAYS